MYEMALLSRIFNPLVVRNMKNWLTIVDLLLIDWWSSIERPLVDGLRMWNWLSWRRYHHHWSML